jgi:hypothetical protein
MLPGLIVQRQKAESAQTPKQFLMNCFERLIPSEAGCFGSNDNEPARRNEAKTWANTDQGTMLLSTMDRLGPVQSPPRFLPGRLCHKQRIAFRMLNENAPIVWKKFMHERTVIRGVTQT